MWVFSTGGFTSAVEHRDDASKVMVRGRDKKSLEEMLSSLKKGLEEGGRTAEEIESFMADMNIYAVPGDYKWRVVLPKSAYAIYLMYEAMHYVNYSNFKSKLTATRGDKWHDAAMSVWTAMFKITDTQKTGNAEVDNPKPYSYYHGDYDWAPAGETYPAKKGGSGSSLSEFSAKANRTAGTNRYDSQYWGEQPGDGEDIETWIEDHYGRFGSEADPQERYWGRDIGIEPLFSEDLDGYEVPSGTNGYHSFSGKPINMNDIAGDNDVYDRIDGRADIIDGEFVGSTFLEGELSGPSDAELTRLAEEEENAWERWDEETDFNYVTGETRSRIEGAFDKHKSVASMTDAEFMAYENEM